MTAENMDALMDLAKHRDTPLHPDLAEWVEPEGPIGPMLRHPLVYDIGVTLPGLCNLRYERKREALAKAVEDQDWHQVIFLHERPYRFHAYQTYVAEHASMAEAREILADIWIDSENIHEHYADWMYVLDSWSYSHEGPLTDDPEGLAALPDLIEVWRGGSEPGLSWSTDQTKAQWFADRFGAGHEVFHGFVHKSAIAGYFTGRGESEIVVPDPEVVSLEEA